MSEKDSTFTAEADQVSSADPQVVEPTLGTVTKRRRTAKIDPVLAEAKDLARAGVLEIASEEAIGPVHHLRGEEERLTTHLFECNMPGYRGWFWFATLSRAPRSKQATLCEVGLLPGDDALLAPEWVPWAERLKNINPEELEELEESAELVEGLPELEEEAEDLQDYENNYDDED